jgi:hypothetical protein
VATLQKFSIKKELIPIFIYESMIQWIIDLLNKSLRAEIHVFCLDFSTAMLANIMSSPYSLDYLSKDRMIFKTQQVPHR